MAYGVVKTTLASFFGTFLQGTRIDDFDYPEHWDKIRSWPESAITIYGDDGKPIVQSLPLTLSPENPETDPDDTSESSSEEEPTPKTTVRRRRVMNGNEPPPERVIDG